MEKKVLEGKIGIVTGAGSGIGEAIANKLAQEGCNLVATDINETSLNRVVKEIQLSGYNAIGVKADVASKAEVELLVSATIQKYGKIDLLVNNAGIYPAAPVTEL
ncbi:MAG: SDR family NAD(P)-dependent oxidoreductase, partial [Candidatus Heimdallarchaeaceae archaeon]